MALSAKQQVFIESYLQTWNATEAARQAGYKHPNKQGPRLLVNVGIAAAVQARIKELTMSADEVMVRLTEHARGNIGQFVGKTLTAIQAMPEARLIKTFDHSVKGTGIFREEHTKIELYSAQAALLHLWKHHQIDQGKATENINVVDAKERLAQLIARQSGRPEPSSDPQPTE